MVGVIRIVIADDHPMVRRALAESLGQALGTAPRIAEVGSLPEAQAALNRGKTDLLLLDINMPGMDGLLGLALLRANYPAVPVLVVSADEDPSIMRQAIDFGASGFLPKSAPVGAIGEAVNAILTGDVWLPQPPGEAEPEEREADLGARVNELTLQQRRVLLLLSEGKANKQIAFELKVTEATIKAHLSQIFKKLGVRSRTQAVIAARRLHPEAAGKPAG